MIPNIPYYSSDPLAPLYQSMPHFMAIKANLQLTAFLALLINSLHLYSFDDFFPKSVGALFTQLMRAEAQRQLYQLLNPLYFRFPRRLP